MERRQTGGTESYRLMEVMVKLNAALLFLTLHPSKHTDTVPGAALLGVRVPKGGDPWPRQCHRGLLASLVSEGGAVKSAGKVCLFTARRNARHEMTDRHENCSQYEFG